MPSSVNASPMKVYVMLFMLVVMCYVVFIIIQTTQKRNKDLEHFVEESPNYKYRLEVMKVFDLYMNRNPTPDEIEKYARIGNEQDILLAILKDFNISASDVNKEKLGKYAEGVKEEYMAVAGDSDDDDEKVVEVPAPTTAPAAVDKLLAETYKEIKSVDSSGADLKVTRKQYDDLKNRVVELHAVVTAMDGMGGQKP